MADTPLHIPWLVDNNKWDDYRLRIWGNSFTWNWERPTHQVQYLAIHHSVTNIRPDWKPRQYADEIALIHKKRGWAGVGYHFIVAPDGTVMYVGDVGTARANVLDNNEKVIGICMVGDFTKHLPTDEQITSMHELTSWFMQQLATWPNLKADYNEAVRGHKELCQMFNLPATACPGSSWPVDMKDRIKHGIVYTPQPVHNPDGTITVTIPEETPQTGTDSQATTSPDASETVSTGDSSTTVPSEGGETTVSDIPASNTPPIEGIKEFARIILIAIVPVLIDLLANGTIDPKTIGIGVLIAALKAADKWLHKEGVERENLTLSKGLTRF